MSGSRLPEVVPIGEGESGLWCDVCLLPSMIAQRYALVRGFKVVDEVEVVWCEDCGREIDP